MPRSIKCYAHNIAKHAFYIFHSVLSINELQNSPYTMLINIIYQCPTLPHSQRHTTEMS